MQFDDDRKLPLTVDEKNRFETFFPNLQDDSKKEYNKNLCNEFPFLIPSNRFSGKRIFPPEAGYWPGSPNAIPEYDFEYTELDAMPEGWRISFGIQMCQEIKSELIRFNYLNDYRITQIKEKLGQLRWYDNGAPIGKLSDCDFVLEKDDYGYPECNPYIEAYSYQGSFNGKYIYNHYNILDKCLIPEIIQKFEKLSQYTCINCGKPATRITAGWISPWCDDCCKEPSVAIKDFYNEDKD